MTEPSDADGVPPAPTSRAGRDVPVAIAVGLGLGAAILVPLYTQKAVFVGVVALAIAIGCHEMSVALGEGVGRRVPFVPIAVGSTAAYVAAYQRGSQALAVAVLLTAVAATIWRLLDGGQGVRLARDLAATLFVLVYVVTMAGFCVLLTAPHDGARRVTTFIATVVCSDVGGYAAGVLAGRRLMAPSISPKKTWEGFAGSATACMVCGAILMATVMHRGVGQGVVFGLAMVCAATVGDLGESMIKRDLGVKDMGRLLPGHGGLMERLDSLLVAAPVAYLLLSSFAPVG